MYTLLSTSRPTYYHLMSDSKVPHNQSGSFEKVLTTGIGINGALAGPMLPSLP